MASASRPRIRPTELRVAPARVGRGRAHRGLVPRVRDEVVEPMTDRKPGRPAIGPAFSLRLPAEMLAAIDADAKRWGVSRAEWIRGTCADRLAQDRVE